MVRDGVLEVELDQGASRLDIASKLSFTNEQHGHLQQELQRLSKGSDTPKDIP